eukprot:364950-Chlamydomonas_euryale.AAC.24
MFAIASLNFGLQAFTACAACMLACIRAALQLLPAATEDARVAEDAAAPGRQLRGAVHRTHRTRRLVLRHQPVLVGRPHLSQHGSAVRCAGRHPPERHRRWHRHRPVEPATGHSAARERGRLHHWKRHLLLRTLCLVRRRARQVRLGRRQPKVRLARVQHRRARRVALTAAALVAQRRAADAAGHVRVDAPERPCHAAYERAVALCGARRQERTAGVEVAAHCDRERVPNVEHLLLHAHAPPRRRRVRHVRQRQPPRQQRAQRG